MTNLTRRTAILAVFFVVAGNPAHAARDINAGPIWDNMDAQRKCPAVCSTAGGTWNGNWTTKVFGQSSVCSCDVRKDRRVRNYNAGPIWNNADAGMKCPGVCTSHDRTWTGNWQTTVPGQMSQCGCKR